MKIWAEHQTSSGEKVIKCPFCREDFGPAEYLREEYRNTVVPGLYRQRATEHNGTLCRVCSQSPIQGKCYRWVCGLCSYPIRSNRYIYTVEFIWIYFAIVATECITLRTHVDGTGLKWMWLYKKQLTSRPMTVSQKLECKWTHRYYRCSRCNEYHLCQKCFNTPTHADHSFEFRAVSTKHSGSMRCGLLESCFLSVKERATPSMTQTMPVNEISHCHA